MKTKISRLIRHEPFMHAKRSLRGVVWVGGFVLCIFIIPVKVSQEERSRMVIAYGLRPENMSLDLERDGIKDFVSIYGKLPTSTLDWDILRTIVYNKN